MNKSEMINKLLKASDAYYNKSAPVMSDAEYDALYDEFKSKYPNDPFLKTIGSSIDPTSKWEKATHKIPMGSLNKVTNIDELFDWARKAQTVIYCMSEKLDGISLDLEYEKGILVKAITRGDGIVGEDITKNVIKMQGVEELLTDEFTGSVRGEIILKQADFDAIVAIQKQRGETPIKNLRNGASGLAKRYDSKYSEFLSVVYYDVTGNFRSKREKFSFIEKTLELPTSFVAFGEIEDLSEVYTEYENEKRASLDYEIDGLVIDVNLLSQYDSLGSKDGRPKGAVAYKFTSLKKITKIRNVTWQIGNSGTLTPVAELDPVDMGGVTVSRVSLHNLEIFKQLNLYEGAKVLISRRGDVIPYLEKVIE